MQVSSFLDWARYCIGHGSPCRDRIQMYQYHFESRAAFAIAMPQVTQKKAARSLKSIQRETDRVYCDDERVSFHPSKYMLHVPVWKVLRRLKPVRGTHEIKLIFAGSLQSFSFLFFSSLFFSCNRWQSPGATSGLPAFQVGFEGLVSAYRRR